MIDISIFIKERREVYVWAQISIVCIYWPCHSPVAFKAGAGKSLYHYISYSVVKEFNPDKAKWGWPVNCSQPPCGRMGHPTRFRSRFF